MLRQKFDQQWTVRKSHSSEAEHARTLKLIKSSIIPVEAKLNGPTLVLEDLLAIEVNDVLTFDYPVNREVDLLLNGTIKFAGSIAQSGQKRAFQITQHGRLND